MPKSPIPEQLQGFIKNEPEPIGAEYPREYGHARKTLRGIAEMEAHYKTETEQLLSFRRSVIRQIGKYGLRFIEVLRKRPDIEWLFDPQNPYCLTKNELNESFTENTEMGVDRYDGYNNFQKYRLESLPEHVNPEIQAQHFQMEKRQNLDRLITASDSEERMEVIQNFKKNGLAWLFDPTNPWSYTKSELKMLTQELKATKYQRSEYVHPFTDEDIVEMGLANLRES